MKLDELYRINQDLDKLFDQEYDFHKEEILNKNKLELFVELAELANSSKCFKYWSQKNSDYQDTLYEYVDGLMMILTWFNITDKKLSFNETCDIKEPTKIFLQLFNLYNDFIYSSIDNLDKILALYLHLGNVLKLKEEDIYLAFTDKVNKTRKDLINE